MHSVPIALRDDIAKSYKIVFLPIISVIFIARNIRTKIKAKYNKMMQPIILNIAD